MDDRFEKVIGWLIKEFIGRDEKIGFDIADTLDSRDQTETVTILNTAFLVALSGEENPQYDKALQFLDRMRKIDKWQGIVEFYLEGLEKIAEEIDAAVESDSQIDADLESLYEWVNNGTHGIDDNNSRELLWSFFFPEGEGLYERRNEKTDELRNKRTIKITGINTSPISDTASQILFTSNALITVPSSSDSIDKLPISDSVKEKLSDLIYEEQAYWYDHPVRIGVNEGNNEILYGLRGLDRAISFEKARGNIPESRRVKCILSVSVTHNGLRNVAKPYIEDLIKRSRGIDNIDIFIFTEKDTKRILDEIIYPAARRFLNRHTSALSEVFGVDGEYGRHYSFLKAIAVFWNIMIDNDIKATFKIDLDQVFPQEELLSQTGKSALEQFKTGLWGASGIGYDERPVELGMIAGALVNEFDIEKGLFTPDVPFPSDKLSPDEYIFFSHLPQALSTRAEMMARYGENSIDGNNKCIERIHVTGGTNGILVESLKRHRAFTPTFIGRAEDQAYILSALYNRRERLAYLHRDGLIMRHDKESFAREAIESARVSKLIGDYIRILYFSSYARVLTDNLQELKELKALVDPFTGCFISRIPLSVVYLRFAFKAFSLLKDGKKDEYMKFISSGSKRITEAVEFAFGERSRLEKQYETERHGWKLFYDTLAAIEEGLCNVDGFALELRKKSQDIVNRCRIDT